MAHTDISSFTFALHRWAPGVRRFNVSHPDIGDLGIMYLDLCSRPQKFPGNVTFPIRCGKRHSDGSYQTPVVALVCDFGHSASDANDVSLRPAELRTLMHELGHCMHSLTSRTRYQHLWGTRCAQDLAEVNQ